MFANCLSLVYSPDISKWYTKDFSNRNNMFENCLLILSSANKEFIINSKNYESKNFHYIP